MTHVELISPNERLSPQLGGTGYLPPATPATLPELADAVRAGQIVWKVARASVNWRRPANIRLLNLGTVRIKCMVIGGQCDWYFVHVLS